MYVLQVYLGSFAKHTLVWRKWVDRVDYGSHTVQIWWAWSTHFWQHL